MIVKELLKTQLDEKQPVVEFSNLAGVNLCDLWLTVNEYELVVKKDEKTYFRITAPTIVYAQFTLTQLQHIEKLLREKRIRYGVYYHPPFYYKGQGNRWLATVQLDCGHGNPQNIYLVDFGYSYGKITVNGIPVDITHSGGTNNGEWVDFTYGFTLVGENKRAAIESLINNLA